MRCETLKLKTCCARCGEPMTAIVGLNVMICEHCGARAVPAAPELRRGAGEKIDRAELKNINSRQQRELT